jgi:UDP-N-acetylglucosamine 3-dehydrogenase
LERQLRAGVIGIGTMGRNHARIYSQLPEVTLAAIADVNEALVTSIGRQYNCKPFVDYKDLLKENLDAVSIVVPTTLHREVALNAIRKGINVLVEKPIADNLENADETIAAARQSRVKLMVGHIERFNPAIIRLKELIVAGKLGEIISISAKRVGPYNPRIRDVGVILDLGTHDIDIMPYLCGEQIIEVYASAGSVIHAYEDHALITLNFTHGKNGVIITNWLTPRKVRNLTVIGSQSIAELDYIESTLEIYDNGGMKAVTVQKEEPLKLELQHFIRCVRENREPLVSGEDSQNAIRVALGAIESSKTGRVYHIR